MAVATAVLIGLLLWQEKNIARVREQNQTLSAQMAPSESARVESRAPESHAGEAAADRAELERLRAQSESMRTQLQEAQTNRAALTRSGATTTTSRGSVPDGYVSFLDAQDVGAASGEALFQTFLWAMRTFDTNRIVELLDVSAEGAREDVEKMLSHLPSDADRAEMEHDTADKGFRVIREVPLPDGDVAVVIEATEGSGPEPHREAVRIRRAGNEWRIVAGKHGPEEVKLDPEQMK